MPLCEAATQMGLRCTRNAYGQPLCGIHRNNPNVRLFADIGHEVIDTRVRCRLCTRLAVPDLTHCRQHEQLRPRPDLPPEQRCVHGRCMRAAGQHQRCVRHIQRFVAQQRMMMWEEMYNPGLIRVMDNRETWPHVIQEWRGRIGGFIDANFVMQLEVELAREMRIPALWNRYMAGDAPMNVDGVINWRFGDPGWDDDDDWAPRRAPLPPPRTELEAFTRDVQNVHTPMVVVLTNSGLNILLNVEVPPSQNTYVEVNAAFATHIASNRIQTSLDVIRDVHRDMKRWYRTADCRSEGDFLYKRLLDGLWTKIKQSSDRPELEVRLWEELVDSVGMCCGGHISRLANVLSGFDHAFAPELSPAEKLQNKMAAIAGMDGGIILQVAEAMAVFQELNIPRDQWAPWIDAL